LGRCREIAVAAPCLEATLAAALLLVAPPAWTEGEPERFSFHPSIRVVGVADDNPFFEDGDSDWGLGAWIQPRIEAGYHRRAIEVGVDLGADLRRTIDEPDLSREYWRLTGFAEVGLLPGLSLRISDTYAPQPFQLGRPEDDAENLVQSHRLDARIRYWRQLPRGRELEFGLRGTRFMSESFRVERPDGGGGLVIDDHFHPDFWEGAAYGEIQNHFGRLTTGFLRSQVRTRSLDEASDSDHTDVSVLVGVRSRRFSNLELELAGGWGLVSFASLGSSNRFLGRGDLRQQLPRGWSWRLTLENKFTADLSGDDFLESSGRVEVEKRFGERTAVTVGAFLSRFENEAWSRDDNFFGGAEVELRRQLTRRAQVKLSYRHWRNGGDYEFDDFGQNRIALEFSYRH
jgi:hypothetical protein